MSHRFAVRVYYEDTDMAGIVYYANYLRYIERARSDWVREIGIDQLEMKAAGVVFAVRRVSVLSHANQMNRFRVQNAWRGEDAQWTEQNWQRRALAPRHWPHHST